MKVNYGEVCPRFDFVKSEESRCKYCHSCCGIYDTYSDCKHSDVPTFEPIPIGTEVYFWEYGRILTKAKVRKATWESVEWLYIVGRKRSHVTAYATLEEANKARAEKLLGEIVGKVKELRKLVGEDGMKSLINENKEIIYLGLKNKI